MNSRGRFAVWAVLGLAMLITAGCSASPSSPPGTPTAATTTAPNTTTPPSTPPEHSATVVPSTRPGASAVVTRISYNWHWPNDANRPGQVSHSAVTPVPQLVKVGWATYTKTSPKFDRLTYVFSGGMPSYKFQFVDTIVSDPKGDVVTIPGSGILRIVFTNAQAHNAAGTVVEGASSNEPDPYRIASFVLVGDFEGVITYGVGVTNPNPNTNPQYPVRVEETALGNGRYMVTFDVS